MPRERRKKAPPFKTKKLPSLLQLRTRRWRCRGQVAMRRRWPRRQKVRQRGGCGGGMHSALLALLCSCSRGTAHGLSGAANVSTCRGSCLSPQSHTEVMASCSTSCSWHFGCLWISCLRGVPWITALLLCLSGGMFILGRSCNAGALLPAASAVAAKHLRGSRGAWGGLQEPLWPRGSSAPTLRLHIKGLPGTWSGPSGFSLSRRRASPLVSSFH